MKEQILKLKGEGLSNSEVVKVLGCAKSTISYHLNSKDKILSRQRVRRQEKKKTLVEYKGGECIKCGYSKCLDALDFHHRDPEDKSFTINVSKNFGIELLKKEADKCDLLCANCHREVHSEERNRRII